MPLDPFSDVYYTLGIALSYVLSLKYIPQLQRTRRPQCLRSAVSGMFVLWLQYRSHACFLTTGQMTLAFDIIYLIFITLHNCPYPCCYGYIFECFQEQRRRGVIAASAGNHALALAYHCHLLDIHCVVVTPVTAPIMKVCVCVCVVCFTVCVNKNPEILKVMSSCILQLKLEFMKILIRQTRTDIVYTYIHVGVSVPQVWSSRRATWGELG